MSTTVIVSNTNGGILILAKRGEKEWEKERYNKMKDLHVHVMRACLPVRYENWDIVELLREDQDSKHPFNSRKKLDEWSEQIWREQQWNEHHSSNSVTEIRTAF